MLQDGEVKTVMEYSDGDYFGELALIRNIPRQASVQAVVIILIIYIYKTDVMLIYLDFKTFRSMMGPMENLLKRNEEKYATYWKPNES